MFDVFEHGFSIPKSQHINYGSKTISLGGPLRKNGDRFQIGLDRLSGSGMEPGGPFFRSKSGGGQIFCLVKKGMFGTSQRRIHDRNSPGTGHILPMGEEDVVV